MTPSSVVFTSYLFNCGGLLYIYIYTLWHICNIYYSIYVTYIYTYINYRLLQYICYICIYIILYRQWNYLAFLPRTRGTLKISGLLCIAWLSIAGLLERKNSATGDRIDRYKSIPPMKKTMIRVYKHDSIVYCIRYLVYPIPHDVYTHYVYKRIRVDYSVYTHLVSCYMDNIEIYCALVPCK